MSSPEPIKRYRCTSLASKRTVWIGLGIAAACLLAPILHAAWLVGVCAVAFLVLFATTLGKKVDVEIGTLGVTLRRRFGSRFISYRSISKIAFVEVAGSGGGGGNTWSVDTVVKITLDDAELLELGTGVVQVAPGSVDSFVIGREGSYGARSEVATAIVREVKAGIRALEVASPTPLERELARGGRPVGEWVEQIVARAKPVDGYREAAVEPEALWAVLESPSASADARAGAAIALRVRIGEVEKARVETLLEACDAPKPGMALERTLLDSETDDEAVTEALSALE